MDIKKMTTREFLFKLKCKMYHYKYAQYYGKEPWESYASRFASYRYAKTHSGKSTDGHTNYLTAVPNPGAGIGHQMANWMAAYYYAKLFYLNFAHIPFSNEHHPLQPNRWEDFLGFGEREETYQEVKAKGYATVLLPTFDGQDKAQVEAIRKIVNAYADRKVVFKCAQDQFLRDLYLIEDDLKKKFRTASARKKDSLKFDSQYFNIAVHVRRTVIIDGKTIEESPEVRAMRWLDNDYYEKVLKGVLENINPGKSVKIWLFSTGKAEEFEDFKKYGEIHFCNDLDEYQSFAHLIFADLLISSKSSFSYKPALMNDGIKVCPKNFWHGYPDREDFILCENDGTFDVEKLKRLFA